jgi:disulfide bond formation protein DsbB
MKGRLVMLATEPSAKSPWVGLAAMVSLVGVFGTVYLSVGMGLKACPLCLYQRIFLMGTAAVLLVGLLLPRASVSPGVLGVLALPLATGGFAVAGWHEYLESVRQVMVCPQGLFNLGTAPQQSLALHAIVLLLLACDALTNRTTIPASVVGIVVGVALAFAAIQSAPRMPLAPDYTLDVDQDMCRPPNPPEKK